MIMHPPEMRSNMNREGLARNRVMVPSFARGLPVLLVDHDTKSLVHTTHLLEELSYKATELLSIGLSMVPAQKGRFRLVLVNIDRIDDENYSLLCTLMRIRDVPFILMSANLHKDTAGRAIASGASYFIYKPLFSARLKCLWQHAFRKRGIRRKRAQSTEHILKVNGRYIPPHLNVDGVAPRTPQTSIDHQGNRKRSASTMEKNKFYATDDKDKRMLKGFDEQQWNNREDNAGLTERVGMDNAGPLQLMNVLHLTQLQVSSHLQKYSSQVKRICQNRETQIPSDSKSCSLNMRGKSFQWPGKQAAIVAGQLGQPSFYFRTGSGYENNTTTQHCILPNSQVSPTDSSPQTNQVAKAPKKQWVKYSGFPNNPTDHSCPASHAKPHNGNKVSTRGRPRKVNQLSAMSNLPKNNDEVDQRLNKSEVRNLSVVVLGLANRKSINARAASTRLPSMWVPPNVESDHDLPNAEPVLSKQTGTTLSAVVTGSTVPNVHLRERAEEELPFIDLGDIVSPQHKTNPSVAFSDFAGILDPLQHMHFSLICNPDEAPIASFELRKELDCVPHSATPINPRPREPFATEVPVNTGEDVMPAQGNQNNAATPGAKFEGENSGSIVADEVEYGDCYPRYSQEDYEAVSRVLQDAMDGLRAICSGLLEDGVSEFFQWQPEAYRGRSPYIE